MSFHQNGQHRYGHVPPAQYGAQQPMQNAGLGLQRQSSFDNGDDATFFDNMNGTRPQSSQTSSYGSQRNRGPLQDELYLEGPVRAPQSPGQSPYSSSQAGYQSQFQTGGLPQSPTHPTYNPQQFVRAHSQNQPQVPASQYNNSQLYNSQGFSPHQPYNPAAYQPQAPIQRQPTQPSYTHTPSYGSPPLLQHNQAFGAPPPPQASPHWSPQPPQPQYGITPQDPYRTPSQHSYEPPTHNAPYGPSASVPLPARPSPYSAPASMPYPTNGNTYQHSHDYRTPSTSSTYPAVTQMPAAPSYSASYDEFNSNSFAARASRPSSSSNPLPPVPIQEEADNISYLQRHPTGRRLPNAPADEDTYSYDDEQGSLSDEARVQEQMYQDIEAVVGGNIGSRSQISQPTAPMSADMLDNELEDILRHNSRTVAVNPAGPGNDPRTPIAAHNPQQMYVYDDDSSDAEAAAGLEAIRIAEEQDSKIGSGAAFGLREPHNSQQTSHDASSDGDYAGVDLGMLGGDYQAQTFYGNNATSSEMKDQEGHEPAPGPGYMTDYSIPDANNLHPFPSNEPGAESFGTDGPQRLDPQRHRLSFCEGDEGGSLGLGMSDSRLGGRSDSDSPSRGYYPMFYPPDTSSATTLNRPLPLPPLDENRTPQLLPAGSYGRGQNQRLETQRLSQGYTPDGPDSYTSPDHLRPGAQFSRSTSLTSHSNTPVVSKPIRSRTDAEEHQARLSAMRQYGITGSGPNGFDISTPQSSVLDLPALPVGRRKKLTPENIRSSDYKKCREPWALSGIAGWIREMCGGETTEGQDLYEKNIADILVALFTHKLPTMNTADAEVISARVVKGMLQAGVLVRDEEWVRLGQGTISGVLWQMTGSGCYAPKLHEHEIRGRCYSHHCHRTLKKINLHEQRLAPAKRAQPWNEFFKLTTEQIAAADKKEVLRQNNLHEIIMSEDRFMAQLDVLRIIYRDDLQTWQPPIIGSTKLPRFIQQVFGRVEAVKKANMDHLLAQLKYRQQEQGPWIVGFSDIFREWIRRARRVYLDYASGYPTAIFLVRKEADRNILFRQFLEQAQANKLSDRLGWDTYLFAPLKRLQQYTLLLREVHKHTYVSNEEKANLLVAIEEVNAVTLECDARVDEENKKVEMTELHTKLFLRPGMEAVDLHLDHLGRKLIFQGDLQRAGANRFTWLETRAILFDHYLVLAKTVTHREIGGQKKKDIYDVSKLPIPMQLLVLESTNDEPVIKSSMKGLATVSTVSSRQVPSAADMRATRPPTASDRPSLDHALTNNSLSKISSTVSGEGDARSMFPFRIKHLGKSEVYTLYAPTAQNRQEWCDNITLAKERHAASLFAQNAEPFRLKVLADSAFASDPVLGLGRSTGISTKGTPLDRAVKEMEREYSHARPSPVCRAQVNCSTTFTVYGKSMIAIGTDYGVYISEVNNPREWTRSIQSIRITQIAVLEDFSLCLIISDKALIAYHLDVLVPAPTSNFPAPRNDSARRAPQKLSGAREVSFFSTARMKDRTLVFYKKREGISSTFKVLEPVFQKSSEKKSKLFSRSRIGGGGTTEFFREFDEFYIPAECFTINLFHTYIAVSTARGFELLTLDKKNPMSIPDLKQPSISSIATRLVGQKPLGMFRLSDAEFLLCYEECGVYVDKHGEVSRSVVLEFVGKAKSAAMYGAYLVLFDSDFVEVRNAENGRLRQVIAGKDVRCLDYGAPSANSPPKRTLKVAMLHPEYANSQLVVEMLLNDGQRE